MLKDTRTYTDYDGTQRTEDFYFNLTKAELMEFNLSVPGGLESHVVRLIAKRDVPGLAKIFKDLIVKSYGEKSPDGRTFIKKPELTEAFLQTEAYSDIYIELITDPDKAEAFIKAVAPPVPEEEYEEAKQKAQMTVL